MAKVARALFRIARATRGRAMRKARWRIRGERSELAVYGFPKSAPKKRKPPKNALVQGESFCYLAVEE